MKKKENYNHYNNDYKNNNNTNRNNDNNKIRFIYSHVYDYY